jgi:hypothetical protein
MLPLGEAIVGFLKRGNSILRYAALSRVKYFSIEYEKDLHLCSMKKCFFRAKGNPNNPWIDGYFHGIFQEGSINDSVRVFAVVSARETEGNKETQLQKIYNLCLLEMQ